MAQTVSRRAFTAEARVRSQVRPTHDLCGGKRGIWKACVSSTSVFATQCHSIMLLHAAVLRRTERTQNNSLSEKQQGGVRWNCQLFSQARNCAELQTHTPVVCTNFVTDKLHCNHHSATNARDVLK